MKSSASTCLATAAGMTKAGLLASAGAAMLMAAGACLADEDNERARAMVQKGEFIPLVEILKLVEREVPGEILEVEIAEREGEPAYELDILDKHDELHEVWVDPYSGEILSVAPHR